MLVTGGSSGIGAAAVRLFTAAGYKTAFIYAHSDEEAGRIAAETGAFPVRADLASSHGAAFAYGQAENYLGETDVLINNCGISLIKMINDTTEEEWDRVFDVNVKSCFLMTKLVLPGMIHRKNGRIINVSSVWGNVGASCEVCYSASKAAVAGYTKALAKELAPSGITVNCIAPGVIDTRMNGCFTAEEKKAICEEIPAGRFGTPEEAAGIMLFLASEQSAYITGQVISPSGGYAMN